MRHHSSLQANNWIHTQYFSRQLPGERCFAGCREDVPSLTRCHLFPWLMFWQLCLSCTQGFVRPRRKEGKSGFNYIFGSDEKRIRISFLLLTDWRSFSCWTKWSNEALSVNSFSSLTDCTFTRCAHLVPCLHCDLPSPLMPVVRVCISFDLGACYWDKKVAAG